MEEIPKQTMVLSELYYTGKKMSVKKIMENTGLSLNQVHNALKDLKNRKLIKKEKVYGDASYKVPPKNKISVEINDKVLPRIKSLLGIV